MPTSPSSTPASATTRPQRRGRLQLLDHATGPPGATGNTTARTSPARSPRSTTAFGVVGVAPGARVWGVKILNDDGYGLISWYICGLDWILAQRDPNDPSRPLFEAVNMSVTKNGSDDHNCGSDQQRSAPPGDLPGHRRRDHGRRRGRQRQPQRVAQHPGQLQRGHHRLGPGRHRWQAGRARWQPLLLVGRLRQGRHVRQLQQLRRRRRHHRAGQMHHVHDPWPRLRLHVRNVDGRPDGRRRGRALQVEPPECHAGRGPRSSALPRQPELEHLHRPRLRPTSRCSTCRRSAARDVRARARAPTAATVEAGQPATVPVDHRPQRDLLRAGQAVDHVAARRAGRARWSPQPDGLDREECRPSRSSCRWARPPAPTRSASRARTRAEPSRSTSRSAWSSDIPTAQPPVTSLIVRA